ncbi:MAG: 2-hydroxyacid dehydrogenase [bacterium]|nr:2-hydroxyacid dehydrogenase [bacterium]
MLSKVVFIDHKEKDIPTSYLQRIKKIFKKHIFVTSDDKGIYEEVSDADAILVTISTKVDKELLDHAKKLKYIGVCSTAFDVIDAKYARSKKIAVCNLGGYSTEAVSEFFFAVLFEQVRELEKGKNQARKEDYSFSRFMGGELKDITLGVIGAGKIGSRIVEIGLGIGMKVIYFSRKNKQALDKRGAEKKTLDEVLSQGDFISLNLVLNKETKNIISKNKINLLKKDCIIINLAPPSLIDQKAIMEKAKNEDIKYIFDHSDDMDKNLVRKFLKTKNCIVYPPIAFRTEGANTARWETFTSNVECFIKGKLQNVVN